jgi:hypothetical protein
MNLGVWDMKIRYWTENSTFECFVRGFLLFLLLLSVSKDSASGLPWSVLSYEYLQFRDAKWDLSMRTCLFCSFCSSFHDISLFPCSAPLPLLPLTPFDVSDPFDTRLALESCTVGEIMPRCRLNTVALSFSSAAYCGLRKTPRKLSYLIGRFWNVSKIRRTPWTKMR